MERERFVDGPAVIIAGDVAVPFGVTDLGRFRNWARSDSFPERGRIDYLHGDVEVDMSPESLNAHGDPKAEIVAVLKALFDERDLGAVYTDRVRLTNAIADLSAEPDVLAFLWGTIESGDAKLVASAAGGDWIEVEGRADLVVEVVSTSSVRKDTVRLRDLYFRAGVAEYWIVDARGAETRLDLLVRQDAGFGSAPAEADGFARSQLLGRRVRLVRLPPRAGLVRHRLEALP